LPQTSQETELHIPYISSLAYPKLTATTTDFILSPLLALPESFQSAYVGEVFSCALCANNELADGDETRTISGVKVSAEILSPSNPSGVVLDLEEAPSALASHGSGSIKPGESLQKILRLDLREEGDHTLAVTVTYTETTVGAEGKAAGGRVRMFRKLYQFAATNLIAVRTKAADLPGGRYTLEAQLENLGERGVVLEVSLLTGRPHHLLTNSSQSVIMNAKEPFKAKSLNGDIGETVNQGTDSKHVPMMLNPRDIVQIAFILTSEQDEEEAAQVAEKAPSPDKRLVLGQLNIQWRSGFGDRGVLSTGTLTGKRKGR
jgi:hypothetical protein